MHKLIVISNLLLLSVSLHVCALVHFWSSRLTFTIDWPHGSSLFPLHAQDMTWERQQSWHVKWLIVNEADLSLSLCLCVPQSEYIAPCDCRREYICGFNGSAGMFCLRVSGNVKVKCNVKVKQRSSVQILIMQTQSQDLTNLVINKFTEIIRL